MDLVGEEWAKNKNYANFKEPDVVEEIQMDWPCD